MKLYKLDDVFSFVDTCIVFSKPSLDLLPNQSIKSSNEVSNEPQKLLKYLVLGDVHIGFEEALNKQGMLIPRTMTKFLFARLKKILYAVKPDVVIINGDLKHEFGRISKQEWNETTQFIEIIETIVPKIIIIKGNHDSILDPITSKKKVIVKKHLLIDDVYITHGNIIPSVEDLDFKRAKIIIIGHEHPALTISDGTKHEKYKAFLVGTFEKKKLLVHPSFHPTIGTDVSKERLLSPFLKKRPLNDFEVYLVAREKDEIYAFGTIGNLH